jgi:hypothetical protein
VNTPVHPKGTIFLFLAGLASVGGISCSSVNFHCQDEFMELAELLQNRADLLAFDCLACIGR